MSARSLAIPKHAQIEVIKLKFQSNFLDLKFFDRDENPSLAPSISRHLCEERRVSSLAWKTAIQLESLPCFLNICIVPLFTSLHSLHP